MKVKKMLFLISFIVSLIIFIFAMNMIRKQNEKKENDEKIVESYWKTNIDWLNNPNIQDVTQASDLIALIHVNELGEAVKETAGLFRTFEVGIIESVYGCEEGETIDIVMIANRQEDPLLEHGQEYLVFTTKNPDQTYSIINGPQGRMEYIDGKLTSLQVIAWQNSKDNQDIEKHKRSDLAVENEDAETVINKIKAVLEN